ASSPAHRLYAAGRRSVTGVSLAWMEHARVVVVGGGQARLAVRRELGGRGVDHVVLERGRIGQTWRDRWDSFCLVTPNWTVQLPGGASGGPEPARFMPRD